MKRLLIGKDNLVGAWIAKRSGGHWYPGAGHAIGLLNEQGTLIAGVSYYGWNGASLWMEIASDGSKQWLNREFLWASFHYPFVQAGAKVICTHTPVSNVESIRFTEKIGFRLMTEIEHGHPTGALRIYAMQRAECRWLALKEENSHGQIQSVRASAS